MEEASDFDTTHHPPATSAEHDEVSRGVAESIVETLDRLPSIGSNELKELVDALINKKGWKRELPKGVPSEMVALLKIHLDKAEQSGKRQKPLSMGVIDQEAPQPGAIQARRNAAIQFMADVLKNEFAHPGKRWASNLTNVTLRTGLIMATCILLRESLAFALAKDDAIGDGNAGWQAGLAMIAGTLALNIIGGAVDIYSQDKEHKMGSAFSVFMRVGLCLLSLASLMGCYGVGTINAIVTRSASLLTYAYARDICNLFFPLNNNVETLPRLGVGVSALCYGLTQFTTSFLPDVLAPAAGAAGVPAVGTMIESLNRTITLEDVLAAELNVSDTLAKALILAVPEVYDDTATPAVFRRFERSALRAKSAAEQFDEEAYHRLEGLLMAWGKGLFDMESEADCRKTIHTNNWVLYGQLLEHLSGKKQKFGKLTHKDGVVYKGLEAIPDEPDETLPPVSALVFGPRELPDFVELKSKLMEAVTAVARKLDKEGYASPSDKELESIARQIYADAYVDAYLPIPTSDLQVALRKVILSQSPELLPQVLRTLVAKNIRAERKARNDKIEAGLRVSLTVANPFNSDFARDLFRSITTTSAARQAVFIAVFGVVYTFSEMIRQGLTQDPEEVNPLAIAAADACLVAAAVIVMYPFFYLVHDRQPSPGGRQLLPGSSGDRELPTLAEDDKLNERIRDASKEFARNADTESSNPSGGSSSSSSSSSISSSSGRSDSSS